MQNELLIFIPTYNERENVEGILRQLLALKLPADILFVDDNSPDGTGDVLDSLAERNANVSVQHREGKLGIGSAHVHGIRYAYERSYRLLLTMDCDFTHSPEYIRDFLANAETADIVVGSRYLQDKSLSSWNAYRRSLTRLGHVATTFLLDMPYDATGAFRLYRLDRISRHFLDCVHSLGYSFLFESLYVLHLNGYQVTEIPTHLPARAYGHSKMRLRDALHSLSHLVHTYLTTRLNKERFVISEPFAGHEGVAKDSQGWDSYWANKDNKPVYLAYDLAAAFYRKFIIRPSLNRMLRKYFSVQANVLHAGCGSGQVDTDVGAVLRITALDISPIALGIYRKANPHHESLMHGSIFAISVPSGTFDGIYNLGVMEHFTEDEILRIMSEFRRVLKPGGRVVLFWPPEFGLSVFALKVIHFVLNNLMKKEVSLHPPEISRLQSRSQAVDFLRRSGFSLKDYVFGPRDAFTYVVLVGEKIVE
jgi:dolichol-phosphate mannosyltransferase